MEIFEKNIKIQSRGRSTSMGVTEIVKKNKIEQFFIQRKEKNFWGKKCKINNVKNCILFKKKKQILNSLIMKIYQF